MVAGCMHAEECHGARPVWCASPAATIPMSAMSRQYDALLSVPLLGGWVCALFLGGLACMAQAQTVPASPIPPVQTRGLSAHAARDAANEQLRPPQEATTTSATTPATTPKPAVLDAVQDPIKPAPRLAQAGPDRGVLFKVTPPPSVPLPAEVATQGAGTDAASPAVVVPPVAPVPASYLLGTIHFGTPEEQAIDYETLGALIGGVDNFVNEADVNSAWLPAFDTYRWLPVETPLGGMIGKDDLLKAQALLPSVRLQDLQRMKPWAVLALLEARGESAGQTSMDARLQQVAAADGKHLLHLETLEQQLQALDCVPAAEHAAVLAERLQKSWVLRIESAEAMAFYRSRNLDAWLASIDRMDGLSDTARSIEQRSRICLLEDRNARWIGPLETIFQDAPSFVAVGAIHLTGTDGLVARLRRDGYTVEAVPF